MMYDSRLTMYVTQSPVPDEDDLLSPTHAIHPESVTRLPCSLSEWNEGGGKCGPTGKRDAFGHRSWMSKGQFVQGYATILGLNGREEGSLNREPSEGVLAVGSDVLY
jgi:hypothetical protein